MKRILVFLAALSAFEVAAAQSTEVTGATTPAEAPAAPVAPPSTAQPAPIHARHFAVGPMLISGQRAKFSGAFISSPTASGSLIIESDFAPAAGLVVEYRNMPKLAWGSQVGVAYELEQNVDKITMTGAGGTTTVTGNGKTKYRNTAIYANVVYRWNEFYIPFGANYSMPTLTETTVTGGVGLQAGVGFQITDLFGLEVISHAAGMSITSTEGAAKLDFGHGTVSGVRVIGKFAF